MGTILYESIAVRPDISFATAQLCKYMGCPTQTHWSGVKRVLRYLRGTTKDGLVLGGHGVDPEGPSPNPDPRTPEDYLDGYRSRHVELDARLPALRYVPFHRLADAWRPGSPRGSNRHRS